uniref:G_PROTEIN_RECEP_F1_2 domain-containing protein n=1 Tax=Haemonchus contortus TaxID=6289 RepID=A0A7I4Y442_HAECO
IKSGMDTSTDNSLAVQEEDSFYKSLIEAGTLLSVSVIGIFCNLLAFTVMVRHEAFRNSFGRLAACYTFSNIGVLIIFMFWATPWTIWAIPSSLHYLNLRMGSLSMCFFQVALHCHLFISINRFVAITFPLCYRKMFTLFATKVAITFIAATSILYSSVYFIGGCDFFYTYSPSGWIYGDEPCTQFLALYVDYYYNSFIFFVSIALDIITVVQLGSRRRKVLARQKKMNGVQAQNDAKMERRELRFLAQAALGTLINFVLYFSGSFVVSMVDARFQILCYTLSWELTHAVAGVIFVAFNPEIRRRLLLKETSLPKTITMMVVSGRADVTNK